MAARQWYIAIRTPAGIRMAIAPDRDAAVKQACDMLGDGVHVTEIGPMIEDAPKLTADELLALVSIRNAA